MSTIVVIRHGQASFGAADYDVLSDRGVQQSRELGSYFARVGQRFDAVYCGPLRRQRDTTRHIADAMTAAGHANAPLFSRPTVDARFDEYPAFEIIAHGLPTLARAGALPPDQARLFAEAARDPITHRHTFERLFRVVLRSWAEGALDHEPGFDAIERFVAFRARVVAGVRELARRHGRGQVLAIVTSGGVIGVALASAISVAPWDSIKASLTVANSSLTEFKYRDPDDLSLNAFNRVPHLEPAHVTLR